MSNEKRIEMSKYLLWNFQWFIAHTERAFDNMVISLYGAYQRHVFGTQQTKHRLSALCQPLRIPIKMRTTRQTTWINENVAHKISNRNSFFFCSRSVRMRLLSPVRPRQKRREDMTLHKCNFSEQPFYGFDIYIRMRQHFYWEKKLYLDTRYYGTNIGAWQRNVWYDMDMVVWYLCVEIEHEHISMSKNESTTLISHSANEH